MEWKESPVLVPHLRKDVLAGFLVTKQAELRKLLFIVVIV